MTLFEPFLLRSLRLENRIVLTALVTRLAGEDGRVTPALRERWLRQARGGPGLLVTEAMSVHGGKSGPLLRISEDRFVPDLRDLVAAVHATGPVKVAAQVLHFLKISRSGWRQKVEDLAVPEVKEIVLQYGRAAVRAREAGFDAVELHMAHAYTVASFMSRLNARTDGYGGSFDNRMRLAGEILEEVRRAAGRDFVVGVRFDADEGIAGGYGEEEAGPIGLRLAQAGADYLSVSAGGKFEDAARRPGQPLYPYTGPSGDRTMPGPDAPDGCNVPLARLVREAVRPIPVVASGKIRTPELAEEVLRSGQADLVGLARALLADPDWPRKVREGRADQIVRCVSMNVCKALDGRFLPVRCFLWPRDAAHAPDPVPGPPPAWPEGELLTVCEDPRGARLSWVGATGAVSGYEIHRAEGAGELRLLTSVRADLRREHVDPGRGERRYAVRAYDPSGRKSPFSPVVRMS